MIKILFFAFFIAFVYSDILTFQPTNNNLWNNNLNWQPNNTVPTNADTAIINSGNCVVTTGGSVQELIITGGTFYVSEASSFSAINVNTSTNNVGIYVSPGSSLNVRDYWNFLGSGVTFQNFGTITLNPRFNSGFISNSGNNTINFKGSLSNIINLDYTIPSGFSFAQITQTFISESGTRNLYFDYRETVQGWILDNNKNSPNLIFNAGVVINGAITSTNDTLSKNSVEFKGTSSINADATWNVNPSFTGSSNGVFFDGSNKLSFVDKSLSISTNTIGGTGALQFTQQQSNTIQTVTLNEDVSISNPNITFIGTWYFSATTSKTLRYTTSRDINQNYTADGVNIVYPSGTRMLDVTNLNLAVLNSGSFTFFDSLNVLKSYTWNIKANFACSPPANTFALSGNTVSFESGIKIFACAFTTVNQINVKTSVTTNGGNSTLQPPPQVNYPENILFESETSDSSITLTGDSSIPNSKNWDITTELIIFGNFAMQSDASTSGSGQLTVNGGSVTFNQNVVGTRLCFNSRSVTLTSTNNNRVSLNGGLYLRNTYLTGTANIWLGNNNIYLTKGLSTIDNVNFKFKNGVITSVNFDGIGVNPGAQLDITGSGNNFRTIESSFTANKKVNIVFRDQVQYNFTVNFSTDVNSSITFMQPLTSISGGYDITYNGNFYFNGTSTNLVGQGSYSFSANSVVFLTSSLNVNGVSSVAPIYFSSVTLYALNDLTIGSVAIFNSLIDFRDNDNILTTASTTVTLQNDRRMDGLWKYGSNVIVQGNIIISDGGSVTAPGYLQINGNQISLEADFVMFCKIILSNPTTILSFDGSAHSLTLGEINTNLTYVAHGLTLPTLTIQNPITLTINNGQSSSMNVLFNGNIGGTGFLTLTSIVGTTTSALTFSTQTLSLDSVTLVGSGTFTLSPKSSSISFSKYAYAQISATVTVPQITGSNNIDIIGFFFTANPTTFTGATSYRFRDTRTVSVNYVATSSLQFLGDVTLGGSFSGLGRITFNAGVILSSSQSITTNPVTFGTTLTSLIVLSGSSFTLSLSGPSVNVTGRVEVSGTASISSSSPSTNAYIHLINGGGVIPSSWTWSNTIKLGNLNVTGPRILSFPIQLSSGQTTNFNDGITFTNTGSFLPDPVGISNLLVEKGITSNTNVVIPSEITVTTSGQSTFNFGGTNVIQINGTFNCQTRLNFATSVTFGYDTSTSSTQNLNIENGCFFFGTTQTLIINRQIISVKATSPTNIYFEPILTFGLLPPLFSNITSGSSVLLLKGNINVFGNKFVITGNTVFLDAINITTYQNSTLTNLNPNATLTFSSSTNPWVEPEVTFNSQLNQNIFLNGPIRLVSQTIGPRGNFVGTGQNRVAFVNSLVLFSLQVTYAFSAPIQLYVDLPTTDFVLNAGQNNFYFNQVPSLFNPLGLAAPNFRVQGFNPIVRFSFSGAVTFGNVWVETTQSGTLRLSSGVTFNAATLTVNGKNNFWVDSATVNLENLFFSQDNNGNNPSTFLYTVSSATPPTVTVSRYTFYQGVAVVVVNNYVWTSGSVTAITSANSNTAVQFSRITGSPGYTFSQTKSGNNIVFSATQIPTISPFPTQSNGPSPIVSSASFILFNFALLFTLLIYIF